MDDNKISAKQPQGQKIHAQNVHINFPKEQLLTSRTLPGYTHRRSPRIKKEDLTANDRVRIFQNGGPCLPSCPPDKDTPTSGYVKAWLDAGGGDVNYAVQLSKLDTCKR